ncbi:MAG: hypothetical protein LC647_00600, partial [Beggiatoa sp.]|nr:hypothetical protein [Beggiatoa sp.]
TLPQAKLLLAAILFEDVLTLERALDIVQYRQARNYAAYRSHWARTDARHRMRRKQGKFKKVSL